MQPIAVGIVLVSTVAFTGLTHAATSCVATSGDLDAALTQASSNGQANTIRVVAGTYATPGHAFTYTSSGTASLDIEGGYDATCTLQSAVPGTTTLDGQTASTVMNISSAGDVVLRHLTLQNGAYTGVASGIAVILNGAGASLEFEDNVVRANAKTAMAVATDGTVNVRNTLFAGNGATTSNADVIDIEGLSSTQLATVYFVNDDFVSNATIAAAVDFLYATGEVSNSIAVFNTTSCAFNEVGSGGVGFFYNDVQSLCNVPPALITATGYLDPQFVDPASDYHLSATSPFRNFGILNPGGSLPFTDLEGHPRTFARAIDLGVYQHGDGIFVYGFESP